MRDVVALISSTGEEFVVTTHAVMEEECTSFEVLWRLPDFHRALEEERVGVQHHDLVKPREQERDDLDVEILESALAVSKIFTKDFFLRLVAVQERRRRETHIVDANAVIQHLQSRAQLLVQVPAVRDLDGQVHAHRAQLHDQRDAEEHDAIVQRQYEPAWRCCLQRDASEAFSYTGQACAPRRDLRLRWHRRPEAE